MLASEARVLNPKACEVQGRSPSGGYGGEALHQKYFLFSQMEKFMDKFAETNEKLIFRFLVYEIWPFLYSKLVNFWWILSTKLTITQKISEIWSFIRFSKDCAHLACEDSHFWGGGGLHWYYWMRIGNNLIETLKKKKYCFWLQYCYGTWDLEKTRLALNPHRKNISFCFRLQYYFDSWNLKKNQPRWTICTKLCFR